MSPAELSIATLPKGKRRWLVRALKAAAAAKEAQWLDTAAATVGIAFASNRRGEFTEAAVQRWLNDHIDELPRLMSEAAALALPKVAKDRALDALSATNEAEFWTAVQSAAALAGPTWGKEARAG